MVDLAVPLSRLLRSKSLVSKFARLGVENLGDLLWYPPRRTYRWGELTAFDTLRVGDDVTLCAAVMSAQLGWTRRHDKAMLTVTLQDKLDSNNNRLVVRFFAKSPYALEFHAKRLASGTVGLFAGKLTGSPGSFPYLAHPEYQVLEDYDPALAQSLSTRPQPLYHATAGLPSWKIAEIIDAQLDAYGSANIPEAIDENVRHQHDLLDAATAIVCLHHPQSDQDFERAREYLRFREALTLGAALAKSRNQARSRQAWSLSVSGGMLEEFYNHLPFRLTDGQQQVWQEIASDLSGQAPMNRLLQGEVGSGKTVVATLAALAAVRNGCQAAFMAPTEVLAQQHFETIKKLLGDLYNPVADLAGEESVELRLLTGATATAEKREIKDRLRAGRPLLVVGTHALLSQGVDFTKLAVVVVDEQHRFGVEQRAQLLASGERAPHLLAMSATPIPRTVAMTVFGDLDISTLSELPAGRGEVETYVVAQENERWMERVWQRAAEEIAEGGRVYVLCPQITTDDSAPAAQSSWDDGLDLEQLGDNRRLHTVTDTAHELSQMPIFRNTAIAQAHSALDSAAKQRAIEDFASGTKPLLVCTTVIEVGMDVKDASMMIILDADRFGLSQLHQLRGRIGRGTRPGLCLAVAPALSATAAARLAAFASSRDGFYLAEKDLEIRREGDVLGATQSGKSHLLVLSMNDAEVIAAAKAAADEIVAGDPALSDHPELARLVFALGSQGENLRKT